MAHHTSNQAEGHGHEHRHEHEHGCCSHCPRQIELLELVNHNLKEIRDIMDAGVQKLLDAADAAIAKLGQGGGGNLPAADEATVIDKAAKLAAAAGTTLPTSAPTISSILPTSGPTGTSVTLTGTGFGSTQGSSTVSVNGTPVNPSNWSDTSISLPVSGASQTSAVIAVTVGGVTSASSAVFAIS